jgi:hypothetical protein
VHKRGSVPASFVEQNIESFVPSNGQLAALTIADSSIKIFKLGFAPKKGRRE